MAQFSSLTVSTSWDLLRAEYQSILTAIGHLYQTLSTQELKMVSLSRDHNHSTLLHDTLQTRIETNLKNHRKVEVGSGFKIAEKNCLTALQDIKKMGGEAPNCN